MDCSTPGFPVLHYLLEFAQIMSIELMMPSNHLNPLSPPSPLAFNLSQHQGLFQWDGSSHQVAKLGASASVLPKNISGLISFRIYWFDVLAVQGTLKSLLQHHSSKASILWCSAFLMVQLSHPYITTRKTIALTIQTFVAKWCLCFLIHCLGYGFSSKEQVSLNFMVAITIHSGLGVQEN